MVAGGPCGRISQAGTSGRVGGERPQRLELSAAVHSHCYRPSPVPLPSLPGSGGDWCFAPVKPSTLPAARLLLPPAPRLAASDGAALRGAPAAAPAGAYKRGHRRGEPRR